MAVIGFVQQKGGVTKSTLARALAVEATRGGLSAKVADLDVAQGSVTEWLRRRLAAGVNPVVEAQLYPSAKAALREADRYDLLVLDSPGRADAETREIAEVSDLVVVPSGTSLDDLNPAIRVANSLVKAKIPRERILFVLSKTDSAAAVERARAYIGEAGYSVATGSIPSRQHYQDIQDEGRAVTEARHATLRDAALGVLQAVIHAVPGSSDPAAQVAAEPTAVEPAPGGRPAGCGQGGKTAHG